MEPVILFHTQAYQYLAQRVLDASAGQITAGTTEIKDFPDGEHYHRITTDIHNKDILLLGGTTDDRSTLELLDLAMGCVQYGARSLRIVIPYFGYATMERAVKKGEIVKAKTRALLFSAIPQTPGGNTVAMIDLHADGLPYYFEGGIKPVHLYAKEVIKAAAQEFGGSSFVLAATDAGRAKWVESLANDMHADAAFIIKRRISGSETAVSGINADVKDRTVVIYDDMIRTGSSLVEAAKSYYKAGAKEIYVITTHGLFTNGALDKIAALPYVKKVICTDTHPNTNILQHPLLEVKTVAGLIISILN
jgi:ribose-phosphate pyrophosphokinase